jgi:hypothetical protein
VGKEEERKRGRDKRREKREERGIFKKINDEERKRK